jgi:hypothetical protein
MSDTTNTALQLRQVTELSEVMKSGLDAEQLEHCYNMWEINDP